jgi:hypothetical protein
VDEYMSYWIFFVIGCYYACFVILVLLSKKILVFKLMNVWLFVCYYIYICFQCDVL